MPLVKSSSDAAFKTNVGNLMHEIGKSPHVKNRAQALAIAYDVKRRNRAFGGLVGSPWGYMANRGAPAANAAPAMSSPMMSHMMPAGAPAGGMSNAAPMAGVAPAPPQMFSGTMGGTPPTMPAAGVAMPPPAMTLSGQSIAPTTPSSPAQPAGTPWLNSMPGGRAHGGAAQNRDMGGQIKPAGWQTRAEARGLTHAGPINSMVPGRTDNHPMSVKAGSYVVNADTVSHIGQNNSGAGQAILSKMFGGAGPYGVGHDMAVKHGAGAPKPPRPMGGTKPIVMPKAFGMPADTGGARGTHHSGDVDINAAGGEYVIPPHAVLNWMWRNGLKPDLDHGHKILDKWMQAERKDHIRTLKKLPGPAKS